MHDEYLIHIVDDDTAVRDAVSRLVESVGLTSICHSSAEAFIQSFDHEVPSVLILDVRMSGMGGMELQEWLIEKSILIPVVVISGHGDIPMAVEAIQKGAVDFIEKPFRNQTLLDRIRQAIKLDRQRRISTNELSKVKSFYSALTDREKEVCHYIVEGMQSKEIARLMEVSPRTVEGHRSSVLKKMHANTTQELLLTLLQIKKSSKEVII